MIVHASPEELAAQTDAAVAHAAACDACARLLDDQRDIARLLGGLPAPGLKRSEREAMAAELLARADELPGREAGARRGVAPHRAWLAVAGALAAAAAIVTALSLPRAERSDSPAAPMPRSPVSSASRVVQTEPPPPPSIVEPRPDAVVSGSGSFTRTGEVIALDAGDVTVDARDTTPAKVVRGDTAIAVRDARVKIVTRRGVIAQVHVFAGSAQVTVGGSTIVVEQGVTWTRPDPQPAAPMISAKDRSLAAFRTGWEKLRAGDHAAAIAALDQATDEVVAEDAMYWAAVAAERAGRADAKARFERFLAAFPQSPRIDAARAAIERLQN
ncbi:MAG: hypothetical protein JNL83_27465 [Myxococcales bacterium]|nr:hypothetical protein [Myxococcales bacterium]